MRLPVLDKRNFALRYRLGEFGNASPTWDTLESFLSGPRPGLYHFRNGVEPGGETFYRRTLGQIQELWERAEKPSDWYVSEQIPADVEAGLKLQGEVFESTSGLYLFYTTVAKPMREALAERSDSAYGLVAMSLLRVLMDVNSFEWLMELLSLYDGHVVEFSTFSRPWGTLFPLYNTVFWEVRDY